MKRFDRMSLKRWVGPAAAALALAGLLAALSTAVLGAFDNGAQAPEVIYRTARPATPTRTPTLSPTPTITLTPSETPTPTMTPTPFPEKDPADLGNTVVIGGSTGSSFLETCCVNYVPMFDGNSSGSFGGVGHVVLPGAITHLSVHLTSPVQGNDAFVFSISINGKKSTVSCSVPAKGKGDYCEAGDKLGDCIEVGPQDTIAVQAYPTFVNGGGQPAGPVNGADHIQMSWAAKLDLYGECHAPFVGQNSCQGANACAGNTGRIGDGSCNEVSACMNNSGSIGDASCNGGGFLLGQSGSIATGSPGACFFNLGSIGNNSCNGFVACAFNLGDIGNNQCNFNFACMGSA